MKKVMVVFGTRPEAIKMCPLVNVLKMNPNFNIVVCVSGQHREMLSQVLSVFNVIPNYNLLIMKDGQTLSEITTSILNSISPVLMNELPDLVLVHGDTTTTFATSLACFYHKIPVGHVEAGLRTFNMYSPYPEEFNRKVVSTISTLHFAPTETSKNNLLKEGIPDSSIFVTGNTAIDALKTTVKSSFSHELIDWAKGSKLILLTAHRRENIGKPMENIFSAINEITRDFQDIKIIYPVHPNPKVREVAFRFFNSNPSVKIIDPLDVFDFHNIISKSHLIVTDSGGIQEEAPSLGIPVLVLRDTTERPEGITAGTLKLIGTNSESVYNGIAQLLVDSSIYDKMANSQNPFGDGNASERISSIVESFFKKN